MKNPFKDREELWNYLSRFQPTFERALTFFKCSDALIAISRKINEGNPGSGPLIERLGDDWVLDHGISMDNPTEDYVQSAGRLSDVIATKNCASDGTDLTNPTPVGYGNINSDNWIVVVTGPETAVCKLITIIIMAAIECYSEVAEAKGGEN